jgi:hypothetical protein
MRLRAGPDGLVFHDQRDDTGNPAQWCRRNCGNCELPGFKQRQPVELDSGHAKSAPQPSIFPADKAINITVNNFSVLLGDIIEPI